LDPSPVVAAQRAAIVAGRRAFLGAVPGLLLACAAPPPAPRVAVAPSAPAAEPDARAQLAAIGARIGGRLGVHALDTGDGARLSLDEDGRFAMTSTFKWMLAGAVLARVDAGRLDLEARVPVTADDLQDYAPVVRARIGEGALSLVDLCAAAVEVSDNAAANLLLRLVDGPEGLTRFLRELGDRVTRLDRMEPELNANAPGDVRDTTSPRAAVDTLQKLALGDVLAARSRARLVAWLVGSRTGARRLRAGLPRGWQVGDKTGTGENGAVNDVAIVWPPKRAPILVAVYTSGSSLPLTELEAAHAEVGRVVAHAFEPSAAQ
jgi:beta-lactamase class A